MGAKEQFQRLVQSAFFQQAWSSCIFYAEKLAALADATQDDILTLAKAYVSAGEARRALALLETKELLSVIQNQAHIPAVLLATQCFVMSEQYEDCAQFVESVFSFDDEESQELLEERVADMEVKRGVEIHPVALLCCNAAKAFDYCDNRTKAIRALKTALRVDPYCTEALAYIQEHGLLGKVEQRELYKSLEFTEGDDWLDEYYRFMLGVSKQGTSANEKTPLTPAAAVATDISTSMQSSVDIQLRQAKIYDEQHKCEEVYRIVRSVYTEDPFNHECTVMYIGAMVDLELKTELFYLGHELVNTYPRKAVSWYAVGCYYWLAKKYEKAQRYLQKATKLDRRYAPAWIALGHVQAAQEESDQAIAAYRTACRLLPGDHRPLIYMGVELLRTNDLVLAAHMLLSALELHPNDQVALNELGVVQMKQGQLQEAYNSLHRAVSIVELISEDSALPGMRWSELYSNLATCCRKMGQFDAALEWYNRCLALDPDCASTHAGIAFTLHLMGQHDRAIESYHRALALRPTDAFCTEMLNRALEDVLNAPSVL